jgi:hypothetical protein
MPSESPLLSDGMSELPAQPATVQKAEQKPNRNLLKPKLKKLKENQVEPKP